MKVLIERKKKVPQAKTTRWGVQMFPGGVIWATGTGTILYYY
jgi:hypothetical protein